MRVLVRAQARFKLYHVTDLEKVPSIKRTGIRPSITQCKGYPQPKGREVASFATDGMTQKRTGVYRSGDDIPYAIVEFEVDDDLLNKGMVGDIYQECRPGYFNSLMPLREFIQIYPESLSRFKEVEVYFPSTMIPPSLITNVYRVETDIP